MIIVAPGKHVLNASRQARVLARVSSATMSPASFKTHTVWRRSPTERGGAEMVEPAGAARSEAKGEEGGCPRPAGGLTNKSNREFGGGVHKA